VGLTDRHVILVSRMQGSPGKYPELRQATKELREIHPQAALFAALRGVAQAAGLRHIADVSAKNHVAYREVKAHWFYQAYDVFLPSVDAVRSRNDLFYIAESRPTERPLPSGRFAHKARAKKKVELKAEITDSAFRVFRAMLKDPEESSVDKRQDERDEGHWQNRPPSSEAAPSDDGAVRFECIEARSWEWPSPEDERLRDLGIVSRDRMHDHRSRRRRGFPYDIGRKVLFDPGERAPVRFLSLGDGVEDADRRYRVIRRVDHVVAHEAGNAGDDRDRALDPLGEAVRHAGLCFHLTNCGVHGLLLPAAVG
jgi:hypothetical protein